MGGGTLVPCLALCLALCLPGNWATAETAVYAFEMDEVPQTLLWGASETEEEETAITLTFAGDCTLGGEPAIRKHPTGFAARVDQNGAAYPFARQQALFASDDFTLVNLEGVLADSQDGKQRKEFNFIGDTAYADILTLGSVECVNLANNHTMDFGERGYQSTLKALEAAGVGAVSEERLCVVEKDGVRIGLTATQFTMNDEKRQRLREQIALLRDLGCKVVIHSMHAGTEYEKGANGWQRLIAQTAAECGAALVVGHHPHVVQGAALYGSVPVLYSLGNNSFGGNSNPADRDALLLRATFHFEKGEPTALEWSLHPIAVSGEKGANNYQPVLLEGAEARRVMERVQAASAIELSPYRDGVGAPQATIVYKGREE